MIWTIHTSLRAMHFLKRKNKNRFRKLLGQTLQSVTLRSLKSSNTLSLYCFYQKVLDNCREEIVKHKIRVPEYFFANTEIYLFAMYFLQNQRIIIFLWVWEVLTRCVNFLFRTGKPNCLFQFPKTNIWRNYYFYSE